MIKKVYKQFLKNFNVTIKFSTLISLILIIIYFLMVLVLSYAPTLFSDFIGFFLLLLILYFLVNFLSPFFYSYFANNLALEGKESSQVNMMSFIGTRRIGKRRGIKNIQQLFKRLIFAYLIYLVLDLLIVSLTVAIGGQIEGSQINIFLNEYNAILNNSEYNVGSEAFFTAINQFIFDNEKTINFISGISNFISISFAFYFFLYKFVRSFINFYALQGDGSFPIAPFFLNKSIKKTLAIKEFGYNKKFHILLLPYYIAVLIVFSLVYLLMFFFLDTTIMLNSLTAMIVTAILLLPFLPVILDFNMLMSEKFRFYYLKISSEDLTKMVGQEVSHYKFSSKEEEEKFNKDFDEFNKKVNQMLKDSEKNLNNKNDSLNNEDDKKDDNENK